MAENNQRIQSESNGRGGARKGAGRKPGSATTKTRDIANRMMEEGISPLEYMLAVMRRSSEHKDPKIQVMRETLAFEAAKAAAPYVHPKLSAVEVSGKDGGAVENVTRIEFVGVSPQ